MRSWDKQKRIFADQKQARTVELGFATFFLNRTNRSGIFNGGIIGGRDQTGPWKIDARFNREELIFRVESIAKFGKRIHLTRMDALKFLAAKAGQLPAKTLTYLDPPYYVKGRELYYDCYQPKDHEKVHHFLTNDFRGRRWIVSYDNVPEIRTLYRNRQRIVYQVGYSAREARAGAEVMFFSDHLQKSPLVGSLTLLERQLYVITIQSPRRDAGGVAFAERTQFGRGLWILPNEPNSGWPRCRRFSPSS